MIKFIDKEKTKKFENLKNDKKIVMEVLQNNEVVNYWLNETSVIFQLFEFIYRKTIQKSRNIKISYKYNYSDLQTIIVTMMLYNYDGTESQIKYKFYNIPTKQGFLNTDKLQEKTGN